MYRIHLTVRIRFNIRTEVHIPIEWASVFFLKCICIIYYRHEVNIKKTNRRYAQYFTIWVLGRFIN